MCLTQDSLEVGNGKQSLVEYMAHFSMWCVGKHPLILGCDLSKPTCTDCVSAKDVLDILRNSDMIAINQDPLGVPAKPLRNPGSARSSGNYVNVCTTQGSALTSNPRVLVWSGPLSGGDFVVMLLNKEGGTASKAQDCVAATVDLAAIGVAHGVKLSCRNLWTNSSCGIITAGTANLTQSVPSHSAVVLRLSPLVYTPAKAAGASQRRVAAPTSPSGSEFVATTQEFEFEAAVASAVRGTEASSASPIPSYMRGGNAAHSGRTTAKGPALDKARIKWNWGNVTQHDSPTAFESIPAVTRGGLILAAGSYGSYGGSKVSNLTALEVETGKWLWNCTMNGTVWASPLVVQASAGRELAVVGSENGSVYAVDTSNGLLRWRLQTGGPVFSSAVTSDPTQPSAAIYVGSWDGFMYKLSRDGRVLGKLHFETEIRATPALHAGNDHETLFFSLGISHVAVTCAADDTMSVKWRENTTSFAYGSPSLSNDATLVLFPPSGDRVAYARHAATGTIAWAHEIGAGRSDTSTQGAVSADGATFFFIGQYNAGNGENALFALDVLSGTAVWPGVGPAEQGRSMGDAGAPAALILDHAGRIWWAGNRNNLTAIDTASGNMTLSVPTWQVRPTVVSTAYG